MRPIAIRGVHLPPGLRRPSATAPVSWLALQPRPRPVGPAVHPLHPRVPPSTLSLYQTRAFHTTPRRQDVFFFSIPAFKSGLLNITRFGLLFVPFVYRYKLWKKYKRTSLALIQIPLFAFCFALALGLDQSPRTGRWRLLLMSENEEVAWARRKQREILLHDGPLLLDADDPRSRLAAKVTTRLVTALEEQDGHIVSGASWPPRQDTTNAKSERDELIEYHAGRLQKYEPSATAKSTFMTFRPGTQNPLKNLEAADWRIYVVDSPLLNAFALPSKDIFIYTGLLTTLPGQDESMLAAVLSHEIAHVAQRHAVENLGFLNLAAVVFDVLRGISFAFTISFPFLTDSAGMTLNWLNDIVAERAYSRKLEEEADAVGLEIMATAGYDPRAMLDLWELMGCVEADAAAAGKVGGVDQMALLRTHPTSEARQDAIRRLMPRAMKLYSTRGPKKASIEIQRERERELAALRKAEEEAAVRIDGVQKTQTKQHEGSTPDAKDQSVPTASDDIRQV